METTKNPRNSNLVLRKLLSMMREGDFRERETLPKEEELARLLNVSRTALRDVLKIMEQEGYIIRVKKKGTVINHKVLASPYRIDIEYEFKEMLELARHRPGFELLSVEELPADAFLAEQLDLPEGRPVYKIRKRVRADGLPVIYCEDYLPREILQSSGDPLPDFGKSVFTLLEEDGRERIDFNVTRLLPEVSRKDVSDLLEYGGPLLTVQEVSYNSRLQALLYAKVYWRWEFFPFQIVRKRY